MIEPKEAWRSSERPTASESWSEFVSSFRKIVQCLQIFGFDIHWGAQQPTNCRLIRRFYRFIWLLINMVAVGYLACQVYYYLELSERLGLKINLVVEYGMATAQVAGTYGLLSLAAWKDGGQLAESLHRIEARMPIRKELLKKIRIASITAVTAPTILVMTIEAAM